MEDCVPLGSYHFCDRGAFVNFAPYIIDDFNAVKLQKDPNPPLNSFVPFLITFCTF